MENTKIAEGAKLMLMHSRYFLLIWLTSLSLVSAPALLFVTESKVRADINEGYVPPPNGGRIERTEAGGSRGCGDFATPVSLNLIAPKDHVATTVSGHPTFLINISVTPSVPVFFTLIEPGLPEPIFKKQIDVNKSGLVDFKLPSDVPELEIGKQYRWTVSVVCNEARPSSNIFAEALIMRVASTPNLEQKLRGVSVGGGNKELQVAETYAGSGFWYNAIANAYKAYQSEPQSQRYSEYFLKLLAQGGLSDVAAQEQQRMRKN